MELEELKNTWEQYDKKISENLRTNKELLKKINLDRAKSTMDTPKKYEYFSLLTNVVFFLYILSSTIKYSDNLGLLLSGILTMIWLVVMISLTIGKLKNLTNIDFYSQSIIEIQRYLAAFSKRYLNYKKIELFTMPIFVIVVAPILGKALKGFNLFTIPLQYAIAVGLGLIIGYPVVLWIYKHWYENKLKNANDFLNELLDYEKDN